MKAQLRNYRESRFFPGDRGELSHAPGFPERASAARVASRRSASQGHRSSVNSLRHYKHALTRTLKKELVESLILPHFDYACAVYHDLTAQQNLKLHRLLNACVRYVFGNIPWHSNVTPYRLALGWLSVTRRREYLIGALAHRVIKFRTPVYLFDRLTPASSRPEIRRSERLASGFFITPRSRTEILRHSFSGSAARVINSLGNVDLENLSTANFKTLLRDSLFRRDQLDWADRCHREGLTLIPPSLLNSLTLNLPPRPRL